MRRTKNEKTTIKIYSWIMLFVASLIYFGFMQFISGINLKQFSIICIMMGLWIFAYENVWEYIKEKNK